MMPKLFTCLKDYSKEQFLKDFAAGIIVAIIALPLSIALAIASGVSPEKGLITAIVGGFFVSLLGGSRVQIGGPTGAFVVIVYGIIQKYGLDGLMVATIIAGIFLILMGVFKLGSMIKFIPYPITTGFTSGIAVIIFSSQIKDFFGLNIDGVPAEFIPKWTVYFKNFSNVNMEAVIVGVLSILIIILWPKINKKIPATLVSIIVVTFSTLLLKLDVSTIGSQFGEISSSLPKFHFPTMNREMIQALIVPGMTIALLGSIESLLSAVVADGMIGGNHRSNIELVGQGVANIFSPLFGGIPVTGAIARTAANIKNGARTPISGIVHSISLLLMMLLLMPYVKFIPMASLAAILMMVAYHMGEWHAFTELSKGPKSDAAIFLVAFFLTVLVDLVVAIEVGMILAAFLFMKRMADVTDFKYLLEENDIKDELPAYRKDLSTEIAFYEINGPFFFGAADKFIQVIKEVEDSPKVLILKMKHVPVIDATGYTALKKLYDMCKHSDTKLIIMEIQESPLKILKNYGFIQMIGQDRICKDIDEAVETANRLIEMKEGSSTEAVTMI
ncbi:SulP family inorganic anion transporter [Marinisporobacter balticus]|uniref:SulP family sulfate permease n=1 Tax=Marinisporobacter balticus TaxID=2018667 RepID=A0A4R2KGF8_9FIRM|nr:sulfate permease [Marinisporobacter balticus]TCO72683.1 SulP family sulfate permease [Marinisporobacter balticus]